MKNFPFVCNFDDDDLNEIQHNLIERDDVACIVDHVAKLYIQAQQKELVAKGMKDGVFLGRSKPDKEWTIYWKIPLGLVKQIETLELGVEVPLAWRETIGEDWWSKNESVLAQKAALAASSVSTEIELY